MRLGFAVLFLFVPYYCIVWPNLMIATMFEYLLRMMVNSSLHPPAQALIMARFELGCQSKIKDVVKRNMNYDLDLTKFFCNIIGTPSASFNSSVYDSPQQAQYLEEGQRKMAVLERTIKACKKMMDIAQEEQREQAEKMYRPDVDARETIKTYVRSVRIGQTLMKQLDGLEAKLRNIKYRCQTEASREMTGYRDLVDWAKTTLKEYEHLLTILTTISLAGSGLSYSSIFRQELPHNYLTLTQLTVAFSVCSASRGNIGLMCLAFVLFNYGSAIPIFQQSILHWATQSSPTTRLIGPPRVWNSLVKILTYSTVVAVAVAVGTLNLTLWDLHYTVGSDGEQKDVSMRFDNLPKSAAMMTFVFGVSIISFAIGACVLHCTANGWGTLFGTTRSENLVNDHGTDIPDFNLNPYSLV